MAVRSAREAAYETIRSRIITMELKPGDELNDHALAQEMGIGTVLIPPAPGALCALGLLTADIKKSYVRTALLASLADA